MSTTADHTALVVDILLALGREPDLKLKKNSVMSEKLFGKRKVIIAKPGLGPGTLDIVGWLTLEHAGRRFAQWFEIDAKTGDAVAMKNQRMRIALVRRCGGFACCVGSVDEARAALERARRGENE